MQLVLPDEMLQQQPEVLPSYELYREAVNDSYTFASELRNLVELGERVNVPGAPLRHAVSRATLTDPDTYRFALISDTVLAASAQDYRNVTNKLLPSTKLAALAILDVYRPALVIAENKVESTLGACVLAHIRAAMADEMLQRPDLWNEARRAVHAMLSPEPRDLQAYGEQATGKEASKSKGKTAAAAPLAIDYAKESLVDEYVLVDLVDRIGAVKGAQTCEQFMTLLLDELDEAKRAFFRALRIDLYYTMLRLRYASRLERDQLVPEYVRKLNDVWRDIGEQFRYSALVTAQTLDQLEAYFASSMRIRLDATVKLVGEFKRRVPLFGEYTQVEGAPKSRGAEELLDKTPIGNYVKQLFVVARPVLGTRYAKEAAEFEKLIVETPLSAVVHERIYADDPILSVTKFFSRAPGSPLSERDEQVEQRVDDLLAASKRTGVVLPGALQSPVPKPR